MYSDKNQRHSTIAREADAGGDGTGAFQSERELQGAAAAAPALPAPARLPRLSRRSRQ